ncbi:MAG: DsrH like protein [Gammaproteobacteria bacterium]|jgi:sulfur relay protein TusB/DsrH|nr:DsrH like protein [Gammaproteobacteria bacterium]
MSILYLWQKPNWHDFPSAVFDATDACILIGDGVFAAVLQEEKPTLPCPLFILAEDLDTRKISSSLNATIIDEAQWLRLILAHSKVVSF